MWIKILQRLLGALTVVALSTTACGSDAATTDTVESSMPDDETAEMADTAEMSDDQTADEPSADHDHGPATIDVDTTAAVPDVSIDLTETDEPGVFDLVVTLTNFTITPENVDGEPVDNEGHMHLLIDGEKIERFTEVERQIMVPDGEHLVEVELNANDHSAYSIDGVPIRAGLTVTGSGHGHDDGTPVQDDVATHDADVEVTVSLTGGSVTVGPDDSDRIDVPLGSVVMIMFSADVEEEAHLHGYDLLTNVEPGENAMLTFTADTAGKFELEFESSGVFIAEFVVS